MAAGHGSASHCRLRRHWPGVPSRLCPDRGGAVFDEFRVLKPQSVLHLLEIAAAQGCVASAVRWSITTSEGQPRTRYPLIPTSSLTTTFGSVRDGPRFAGEDLLDHRTEELKRTVLELRIETVLVVLLTELHAIAEPRVAAILFPGVPDPTHVGGVVVLLKFG